MTHWTRGYVGLPWAFAGRSYDGIDCWGLLWLIYRDVLNVDVASYAAETVDAPERREIAELLAADRVKSPWLSIERGSEREFDCAVFRRGGVDAHIGVVLSPGRMLHILQAGESYIETYASGRWSARLVGLHRHSGLCES